MYCMSGKDLLFSSVQCNITGMQFYFGRTLPVVHVTCMLKLG